MKLLHHPPTRAALNLPGLCPVCGGSAVRKMTCPDGVARETYRCAIDGEVEYEHGRAIAIRVGGVPVVEGESSLSGFQPLEAVAGA